MPAVGDVHPRGLAQDIQSRAGSGSDLRSVEDHTVGLAEHNGAAPCDLDSGELLRLLAEEEFAEVKSTSDGERLMIGSVAQRTHLEEGGALGSLQAESPVLIAGRPHGRGYYQRDGAGGR